MYKIYRFMQCAPNSGTLLAPALVGCVAYRVGGLSTLKRALSPIVLALPLLSLMDAAATFRGLCASLVQTLTFPLTFLFARMTMVGGGMSYEIGGQRYQMRHLLGEGGFSFVYKVTDRHGRGYALKKILAQSEELLAGGLREIEVLRKFGGRPHLLGMVDSVVTDVRPGVKEILILLPIYNSGTLQDALETKAAAHRQDSSLPFFEEAEALVLLDGICAGLLQFHGELPEPYAHYDLKPGNVLLGDDGTPILMDFGSVRPARQRISSRREALQLQEFASINCTMPYRAPELWEPSSNCEVDERVDAWSLGCLLYALVYGQSPFEAAAGEQGGSIAVAVASGRVKFPEPQHPTNGTSAPSCSGGFKQELVMALLDLDYRQRLSVAEARDRARTLLQSVPQP